MVRKITLLGPAGSLKMGKEVLRSGADSVFAGLKGYSRRGFDQELSLKEIEELCLFANENNKKVRLAINTYPSHFKILNLIKYIKQISTSSIDGVILSDIGLCEIIKNEFPQLKIFASVGSSIFNIYDAIAWENAGANSIVLLCNDSPDDIKSIRNAVKCDIEVLVHANKDFTFLGKCWMSSYCASKRLQSNDNQYKQEGSPNTGGICYRICRREWEWESVEHFNFKSDLPNECRMLSLDEIKKYVASGVTCLKVQGREYSIGLVCDLIRFYREIIDSLSFNTYANQLMQDKLQNLETRRNNERTQKTTSLIIRAQGE